jgi:phage-related protein
MTKTADTIIDIRKMGLALEKVSARTNALTLFTVKLKKMALGPIYDLYLDLKAAMRGLIAVFSPFERKIDSTGKAMIVLSGPLGMVVKLFTNLKTSVLFFSALLIGLGAVLASSASGTASLDGAMQALSNAFDFMLAAGSAALDYLKSFDYSIITTAFSELFGLMLDIAPVAFSLLVSLIEGIGEAFVAIQPYIQQVIDFIGIMISATIATVYDLYDALQDVGFFDSIMAVILGFAAGIQNFFAGVKRGLDDTGISASGVFSGIANSFKGMVDFLVDAGLLEYFTLILQRLGDLMEFSGKVFGLLAEYVIKAIMFMYDVAGPVFSAFGDIFKFTIDVLIELLEGDFKGAAKRVFEGLINLVNRVGDAIFGVFEFAIDGIIGAFSRMYDFVADILGEIADLLSPITDGIGSVVGAVGGAVGGVGDFLGFSDGGVVSGPSSGYAVALHGTEAVVPLPDGKTIPVSLQGVGNMGGGDTVSFNINVNGAKGDPKEIAKLVGQEVQRAFRSRSRSGGYGRGI